jgi:hypothetical protein
MTTDGVSDLRYDHVVAACGETYLKNSERWVLALLGGVGLLDDSHGTRLSDL